MSGTIIKPCDCKSGYQDRKYGKGLRVHNLGQTKAKCTVCGKEK